MKLDRRMILLTVAAALVYWALDATVDRWFHPDTAFGHRWLFGATTRDAALRLIGLAAILAIGVGFSAVVGRYRRVAQQLRASRADYQQLYTNAQVGLGRTRVSDGKFLECNDRMAQLLGYDDREHMLRQGHAGRHSVDPDDLARLTAEIRARGEVIGFDSRARCLDGSVKWLRYSARLYPDQDYMEGVAVDVTEEKRALEALEASEREMAGILNSLSEHVVYHDRDMTIRWANRAAAESVHLAPEAMVGARCWEVWARRDAICENCPVQQALRTGRGGEGEMTTLDGRRWLVHGDPVRDDQGRVIGVVEFTTEITARKRAEQALEQYRRAVEGSQDLIAGVDRNYRYILANEAFLRYHGLKRDELIGRTVAEVVGEEIFENQVRAHVDRCLGGRNVRYEMVHRSAAGDEHHLEISYYPLKNGGDVAAGLVAVMRDITEQKRAEEELERQRDFANGLVETARAIIVILDENGRILRLNRFALELTGYTEQEVLGKDWFETFLPPRDRQGVHEVFARALAGSRTRGNENPIVAKDGREILVRWFDSLLRDGRGKLLGLLAVGQDITDLRQKDQQLRQAAKMEAVGRLAGGMAHDFNNMLAIIQGYADLLSRSLAGNHEAHDDIEKIRMASRRAAAMTKRLLALGRRQTIQPRVCQLNAIIHDMGSILGRTIGGNIDLRTDLAVPLWPVKADPTQIEEVILNLVLNACEAMPDGGTLILGTANVELDQDFARTRAEVQPGEYVALTVSDTGAGIGEADRAHIFEPFFTTKQDAGGTGLGLAVCYGIVGQSGGCIEVDSTPGEGTTFRVYLPRTTEAPTEAPGDAPAPAAAQQGQQLPRGSETVLLAEDEQDVRQLIVRVLRECGYRVLETANPREALPLGEHYEGDIDLLIADLVMPGMNGRELAERLKRTRPGMQVLYISGYAEDAVARRGVLAEGVRFLAKPFTPRQIAESIRQALEAGRAGRAPARKPRKARRPEP